jgi:ABC-type transporter MlaC component
MQLGKRFSYFSFAALCLIAVASTMPPSQAQASGKETVEKLVTLFRSWDKGVAPAKVFSEATEYIDYASMSAQVLGAQEWNKLKAAEQTAFTNALRKLVEQRYYPRWHKLFSKGTLTYGSESAGKGDIVLNTVLKVSKNSQNVDWRLDSKKTPPKVVSLKVDEKDLLGTLHDRLSPRLKKSGFTSLLSWLQNKAAEEDN